MLRGALALLGEAPKDAAVAATVLHFPTGAVMVAAGTAMQLQDGEPPVVFTTEAAMRLLPLAPAAWALALLRGHLDRVVDAREPVGNGLSQPLVSPLLPSIASQRAEVRTCVRSM